MLVSKPSIVWSNNQSYIDISFHSLILIGLRNGAAGYDGGCFSFSHGVQGSFLELF